MLICSMCRDGIFLLLKSKCRWLRGSQRCGGGDTRFCQKFKVFTPISCHKANDQRPKSRKWFSFAIAFRIRNLTGRTGELRAEANKQAKRKKEADGEQCRIVAGQYRSDQSLADSLSLSSTMIINRLATLPALAIILLRNIGISSAYPILFEAVKNDRVVSLHACLYRCVCVYIYIYIHTYIHTYKHTYTCVMKHLPSFY